MKFLLGRNASPDALHVDDAPFDLTERVLAIVCDSFDIPDSQKHCLRLEDNLGDIYRSLTKYQLHDDMEYERFFMALEEWLGTFDHSELATGIDFTIRDVILFVLKKTRMSNNSSGPIGFDRSEGAK